MTYHRTNDLALCAFVCRIPAFQQNSGHQGTFRYLCKLLSMHGYHLPQPPQRSATLSTLFRAVTGKKEKAAKVERKSVFIAKYELDWDKLKDWLDRRFTSYDRTFTERFDVVCFDYRYGQVCNRLIYTCSLRICTLFIYPKI